MRVRSGVGFMLLAVIAACAARSGSATREVEQAVPGSSPVLTVWVEKDRRISGKDVMNGCQKWRAKNVECLEAESFENAKIRVYVSDAPCVLRKKNGGVKMAVLAWAIFGGKVILMARCFDAEPGNVFEPLQVSAVVAHEIGHLLGIWTHVPDSCEGTSPLTHKATGRPICGAAIMNKHYAQSVTALTLADSMAFDERSITFSVK